ncbi:MAG TPA: PIN domain-containing protein [Thermoanaerobaculia bacterium]|nr:PIN domain-containing protein [Thermoanaerobaculia bacterium]
MIFLDTSAIYALADMADSKHAEARGLLENLLSQGETLLTHNYVLVESLALVQHRLGSAAAIKLARSASSFDVAWIDSKLHDQAVRRFGRASRRRLSFVDEVSFLVMRSRRVRVAFAFDPDFADRGFRLLKA